jgi:hypothetical protein
MQQAGRGADRLLALHGRRQLGTVATVDGSEVEAAINAV